MPQWYAHLHFAQQRHRHTHKARHRGGRDAERIKTERQSQNYSNYSKEKPLAGLCDTLICNQPNMLCYQPSRQVNHYNTYNEPKWNCGAVGLRSFEESLLMCHRDISPRSIPVQGESVLLVAYCFAETAYTYFEHNPQIPTLPEISMF